ncbi:MAG: potassium/proton antiporter [Anaerolineae bacterium]|nr:potassium/proton antiporter [Anaerolineae bacterium]
MELAAEYILVSIAFVLLVSILASKISARLGVPALLLFLAIGMLIGSEGPGGIYFDDPWLAQFLGVTSLAFILFSGGLETDLDEIRPVMIMGMVLATAGVLVSALLVAGFTLLVLDFSLKEALLLGAIVSSTDAAAVFAVLRSKSLGLRGSLRPLLEFESGSNDPMAVFLTLGMIRLVQDPASSVPDLVLMFFQQMALGLVFGIGMGRAITFVLNRIRLEYDGLYSVASMGLVLLTYGATTTLGGNGFLAAYLAGLVAGNRSFIHRRSLTEFHSGLAWLMQIVMFLTLGLLVFPSQVMPIAPQALLISAALILIARPLAVFATLVWERHLNLREKLFVSWVGLRGAAPIMLATFPLLAGVERSNTIFNLVFFIVLTSALVQGTTLPYVARLLRVDAPIDTRPKYPIAFVPTEPIQSDLLELTIQPGAKAAHKRIVDLEDLPETALIVLIRRNAEFVVPRGATMLEERDNLLVLAEPADLDRLRALVSGPSG